MKTAKANMAIPDSTNEVCPMFLKSLCVLPRPRIHGSERRVNQTPPNTCVATTDAMTDVIDMMKVMLRVVMRFVALSVTGNSG